MTRDHAGAKTGRTLAAMIGVVVLVCGACASTSQRGATPQASAASGGTGVPVVGGSGGGAVGPEAAQQASVEAGGAGQTTAAAGSAASGPTGAATGGATAPARAVATGTVKIGIQLLKSFDASSFGATGSNAGDTHGQAEAVLRYINGHGGIGGHRVEFVYHSTDIVSESFDEQSQRACATFAQDNHVLAAVTMHTGSVALATCLARHGVALIAEHRETYDQPDFAAMPDSLYLPNRMSASRWGTLYADAAVETKFLAKGTKLGLLRFDAPRFARISNTIVKPRLAHHGVPVVDEIAITTPAGSAGLGEVAAQLSSAVLRLRSEGVDRIMFIDYSGLLPYFFMPEAESQKYRPRYALTSIDIPHFLEVNVPPAQLAGAVGVGWLPTEDVDFPQDPAGNAPKALCLDLMRQAGQQLPERTTETLALGYCDGIMFLRDALGGGQSASLAALRAGVDALATRYVSPMTFTTAFAPARHDGAASYRLLAFQGQCSCFKYEGGIREAG